MVKLVGKKSYPFSTHFPPISHPFSTHFSSIFRIFSVVKRSDIWSGWKLHVCVIDFFSQGSFFFGVDSFFLSFALPTVAHRSALACWEEFLSRARLSDHFSYMLLHLLYTVHIPVCGGPADALMGRKSAGFDAVLCEGWQWGLTVEEFLKIGVKNARAIGLIFPVLIFGRIFFFSPFSLSI